MVTKLIKLIVKRHLGAIYESKYFGLLLRVGIGAVFLLAGIGKLVTRTESVDIVGSLGILPFAMIQPVGEVLPWFELALGLCFVLGLFPGFTSAISLPLISAFIVINIFNLQHGLTNPCESCFGNLLVINSRDALIIDVFLLLAALKLLTVGRHFMSLDSLWAGRVRTA